MHTHQSLFARGRNVFFDEKGEGELSRTVPSLHRRAAAPREGVLRDHESAGELVQAARPGIRSADRDRVVDAKSQSARARAGRPQARRRGSSCACPTRRAIRIWRLR